MGTEIKCVLTVSHIGQIDNRFPLDDLDLSGQIDS